MKNTFQMMSEEKNTSFHFVEIQKEPSEVSSAVDNGAVLIILNLTINQIFSSMPVSAPIQTSIYDHVCVR